eukprot:TRINITY_DN189_c0_g1_i1.p1 TRINITY_DN189_c0_g1~~TRINITY_DN189_c0_g1_i1.p1  ORF type:complete len:584 (+),score=62.26 TRINITY_DN189_c0_g1_i1:205-1956(+)
MATASPHHAELLGSAACSFTDNIFFRVLDVWTSNPEHIIPPVKSATITRRSEQVASLSTALHLGSVSEAIDATEVLNCQYTSQYNSDTLQGKKREKEGGHVPPEDEEVEEGGEVESDLDQDHDYDVHRDVLVMRTLLPRRNDKDRPFPERVRFSYDRRTVWFIPGAGDRPSALSSADIPFYYPQVLAYALSYQVLPRGGGIPDAIPLGRFSKERVEKGEEGGEVSYEGIIRVWAILAHPDAPGVIDGASSVPTQCTGRHRKALLHLLERLDAWGNRQARGYVPTGIYDTLFPKDAFMDEYTTLKRKYSCICAAWPEKTDPRKYVYEDVAILAYIKLVWKTLASGPTGTIDSDHDECHKTLDFVDLGCGNGLLTFLLTCEGYCGIGYDPQRRRVWDVYEGLRQQHHLGGSAPLRLEQQGLQADTISFPHARWIIANHADELTPWVPYIAAKSQAGFISLPCCPHDFYGHYSRVVPEKGRYATYCHYILQIAQACGYNDIVAENVRIPAHKSVVHVARPLSTHFDPTPVQALLQAAWQREAPSRHGQGKSHGEGKGGVDTHGGETNPSFVARPLFTPVSRATGHD